MSPSEAAAAIAAGVATVEPTAHVDLAPISDGGDGFLDCLQAHHRAERRSVVVRGPVHLPVAAPYGFDVERRLAIVEAALAIGLARVDPAHLDPLGASTGGLGELLAEVRQAGAVSILLGIGGSATTDGGTGMARALGYRFLDAEGRELAEGGGGLRRLRHIDASGVDPGWLMTAVRAGCDVDSPMVGPQGAARVFAPQKGATPAQVEVLAEGLATLAEVVRSDLGANVGDIRHGGAAGGLGGGLVAFLGADLVAGARLVIDELGLKDRLRGADVLLTGEGRLDGQSLRGKAPVAVGRLARRLGVRSVALVGSTGEGWEAALGDAFDEVLVAGPPSKKGPAHTLTAAAARALAAG